jgi:group I intron endonuclease
MVKGIGTKSIGTVLVNKDLDRAGAVEVKAIGDSSAIVVSGIGEEIESCGPADKIKERIYNVATQKKTIYKENRGKSGIYRFIHTTTGKSYIGSAVNLGRRFSEYFSLQYIKNELKKGNSAIYNSLLKYGYSEFSLEILEYCDKEELISREQYYIDCLNPEYNLLKVAGSCIGYKHTKETRANMSAALVGRKLSAEHITKISAANVGRVFSAEHRANLSISRGTAIEVTDIESGSVVEYSSMNKAAKALGTHIETLRRCVLAEKLFKNRYRVKKSNNIS